ncbi:MAG: hypothetical protein MPJ50_19265 [Pirellulales bacterium]|nr:hypothetical protein [Pirellulales bacterium]
MRQLTSSQQGTPLANRLVLAIVVLFLVGCEGRPEPIEPATGTPAEIFRVEHANTATPHDDIDIASVKDTPEGRVRYRTVQGKLWEVEMETAVDGTHRWKNLRQIVEPNY